MNLLDSIVKELNGDISVIGLCLTLLVALFCSVFINYIYKKTYCGVLYSRNYALSIILMAMVTSIAIKVVNSNITLSLGMLGSLSIIRFRTSIKDPIDIVFMFWAILVGIMSGASLYIPTIVSTILLGITYMLCHCFHFKKSNKYLFTIKVDAEIKDELFNALNGRKGVILKSELYRNQIAEFTYEIDSKDSIKDVLEWQSRLEVVSINLINID